jgi:predicted RND superfamily exporter protein
MIGFLTLLMSSIVPIQELGLFMATGVGVAYLLTYSLFPAMLVLTPQPKVSSHSEARYHIFESMLNFVVKHKSKIVWISLLLSIGGVWGVSQLKADNYLTEELPNDDKYKNGYVYLESQYNGARPIEIALTIKDEAQKAANSNLLTYPVLLEMEKLDHQIRIIYDTKSTFSILEFIRELRALNSPQKDQKTALTEKEYNKIIAPYLVRVQRSKKMKTFINEESRMTRISGLMKDLGGAEVRKRNEELLKFVNDSCNSLDVEITGVANLIDQSNKNIANDMLKGLAIALLLVSFLMALLYRSIKLILVALIPNILPLVLVAGVMAILGIDVKISTALIFTLAFGIVVDDTIHFLSKMKQELDLGFSTKKALFNTYITTGRSIVITSLILCSGFVILSFSNFTSSFYMGILISLTLVFAVIADLMLLPILLLRLKYEENKLD